MITTLIVATSLVGNGSTVTAYTVPWKILASTHLRVEADGVALTNGVDFTVTSYIGDSTSFTTAIAYANTVTLVVTADMPVTQETNFQNHGRFDAEVLERRLDYLTLLAQVEAVLRSTVTGRAMRVPAGETVAELPALASRKGRIPYFNATTGALELKTPAELFTLAGPSFTLSIGTVNHLEAGSTPTAGITGNYPDFELNLGLPTGATGGLTTEPDSGFGTTTNEDGGPDLTLWDQTTLTQRRIRLDDGVPVVVD